MLDCYCVLSGDFPINLHKISNNTFWDKESNELYKLSFMQDVTVFEGNTVASKPIMTFTKLNPIFACINLFNNKSMIASHDIPAHLAKIDLNICANII